MSFFNKIVSFFNSNNSSGGNAMNNNTTTFYDSSSKSSHSSSASAASATPAWTNLVNNNDTEKQFRTVYDPAGDPLQLRQSDQTGSGGEGVIYEFVRNPKYLIKIYKDSILNDRSKMTIIRKRLMDMVNMEVCVKLPFLAWPCMEVYNERREVIGFAMRKCSGKSLLSLRGPENVKRFYPSWDRSHMAGAALDFVRKLKLLAANGVLVNDFNPSNFLLDNKGNIYFIDCDSFQIRAKNGSIHLTRTFFPSHAAPELLNNRQLLTKVRNIHQVEFSAALTVFNILMFGLHPYSYQNFDKKKGGCTTPDENLIAGRCPLGRGSDCLLPEGWYNLWSYLTGSLKGAFIATFKDGHKDPSKRSSLDRLEDELVKLIFEMKRMPERKNLNPSHAKPAMDSKSKTDSQKIRFTANQGRKNVSYPSYIQ